MSMDEEKAAVTEPSSALERGDVFTACDREPIHIPGSVQPHGVLLALRPLAESVQVVAASAAPDAPEAAPALAAWLDDDAAGRVAEPLCLGERHLEDVLLEGLLDRAGRQWNGVLHVEPDGLSLLELEAHEEPAFGIGQRSLLDLLSQGLADIQRQEDVVAACGSAVHSLSRLTGFDRIMAYRFGPDWSGEVIAEALAEPLGDAGPRAARVPTSSYLGLRFPAGDIPAQARALYARNGLRLIPDTRAAAVPLERLDGQAAPIDLSRAVLRAVAPVHLRYLENMGVRASMSVAITLPDGTLWGLIACHHRQGPLAVPGAARRAASMLATALSWRVSLCEREAGRLAASRLRARAAPVLGVLAEPLAPPASEEDIAALARAAGADGMACRPTLPAALRLRGGLLPADPVLEAICAWLDGLVADAPSGAPAGTVVPGGGIGEGSSGGSWLPRAGGQKSDMPRLDLSEPGASVLGPGALVTDRLPELVPPALAERLGADPALSGCGLLALPLAGHASGWLLLFRRELRQLVQWAGDPRKGGGSVSDAAPLSPRASFESWEQEVAGRSAIWSAADLAAAAALRDAIADSLLRRGREIERNNIELRRRDEETRFFADAAAHDLKEPLWQIQVLSSLVRQQLEDLRDATAGDMAAAALSDPPAGLLAELLQMLASIGSSADRMREMLSDLNRLAIAGRQLRRDRPHGLRALAEQAFADLGQVDGERALAEISFEGLGQTRLNCDGGEIRRVFQNLMSNALKYRDPARPLRIRLRAEGPEQPRPGDVVSVFVEDNGLGFEPQLAERLFEPFRRFPPPGAVESEGLGLGLAICQRIVLAHGGSIGALCVPGQGARFNFTLPEVGVPGSDPADPNSAEPGPAEPGPAGPVAAMSGPATAGRVASGPAASGPVASGREGG